MKKILILLLLISLSSIVFSKTIENDSTIVLINPEQYPSYPEGDSTMIKFIGKNLRYPISEIGIRGRVILKLKIEADGSIDSIEVFRGIHQAFDEEAIRVVRLMPKWNPGKQNGIPVACYIYLPISFNASDYIDK